MFELAARASPATFRDNPYLGRNVPSIGTLSSLSVDECKRSIVAHHQSFADLVVSDLVFSVHTSSQLLHEVVCMSLFPGVRSLFEIEVRDLRQE